MRRSTNLMNSISCAALCAIAVTAGAATASADGMRRGSIKDAPMAEAPKSWQGFYIGGRAGVAAGNTSAVNDDDATDYTISGGLYGGHIGYNFQRGIHVFGVEGAYDWSSISGSSACGDDNEWSCKRSVNSMWSVVGRYGVSFGNSLVYGMGGAVWTDMSTKLTEDDGDVLSTSKTTKTGWTAGFGFEHMLSDRLSARIEYAHVDLGTFQQTFGPNLTDIDLKYDTIRVGINLKLSN